MGNGNRYGNHANYQAQEEVMSNNMTDAFADYVEDQPASLAELNRITDEFEELRVLREHKELLGERINHLTRAMRKLENRAVAIERDLGL